MHIGLLQYISTDCIYTSNTSIPCYEINYLFILPFFSKYGYKVNYILSQPCIIAAYCDIGVVAIRVN